MGNVSGLSTDSACDIVEMAGPHCMVLSATPTQWLLVVRGFVEQLDHEMILPGGAALYVVNNVLLRMNHFINPLI